MEQRFYSNTQIIIGVVVAVLLLLFGQVGAFNYFYNVFSGLGGAIQQDSYSFFLGIREDWNFLSRLTELKQENQELRADKLKLESENERLTQKLEDYQTLEKQAQFDLEYVLEPVRVTRFNRNELGDMVVNKGTANGISEGDIAILDQFAVGEVISVLENSSEIRLITSPASEIPAKSQQNRSRGVVKGDVKSGMVLEDVLIEDELKEGELIITTGINSNYPSGLILGKIIEVDQIESDVTKSATISSDLEFNKLENLFIIVDRK